MRVVAGSAKGRNLKSPTGVDIRPTLSRVKEAIFSIIYSHFGHDATGMVIDLYAGSGALGIEALSRGASHCVFIDNSPAAMTLIEENLQNTKLRQLATLLRTPLPEALTQMQPGNRYNVIFCDPPYGVASKSPLKKSVDTTVDSTPDNPSLQILGMVDKLDLLATGGVLIVQVGKYLALPERCGRLQKIKEKLYGETSIQIFEKQADSAISEV